MNATEKEVRNNQDACPYCDDKADECKASLASLKIGAMVRINRCASDSYDNCVLFLAKCLRSTRYSYGLN
jgi:hypothetical protein